jgi:hypothetical protein
MMIPVICKNFDSLNGRLAVSEDMNFIPSTLYSSKIIQNLQQPGSFCLILAGLGVYFYYGIKHSTLEVEESNGDQQNIELTVTAESPVQDYSTNSPTSDLFIPAKNFPTWDD